MMMKRIMIVAWIFVAVLTRAQTNPYVAEIKACEDLMNPQPGANGQLPNIYMKYRVRALNWDDEAVVSNVRIYRQGRNINFFSDQANIYMDDKEAVVIMPVQKMVVINNTSPEMTSRTLNDDFNRMRMAFLDSCTVKSSEIVHGRRVVTLTVDPSKVDESIKIRKMIYEYEPSTKKVISVKTLYSNDYQLKELYVVYLEQTAESQYEFQPLRKTVLDRRGALREQYLGYEIMDNRENTKKSKAK